MALARQGNMQNLQQFVEINDAERVRRAEYKQYVVGAVDANGTIREIVCKPRKDDPIKGLEHGYACVEFIQGEPAITAYGKRMGWTLLRDRCEKDGCPERYDEFLRVVRARVDGLAVQVDDLSTILPPSVIEQRRNVKNDTTSQVYFAGVGLVDVAGMSEDQRKERIASLASQLGMEVPEDASAKKGRK